MRQINIYFNKIFNLLKKVLSFLFTIINIKVLFLLCLLSIALIVSVDHITWLVHDVHYIPMMDQGSFANDWNLYEGDFISLNVLVLLHYFFTPVYGHVSSITKIWALFNTVFLHNTNVFLIYFQIILIFSNCFILWKAFKKHSTIFQSIFYLIILLIIFNLSIPDLNRVYIAANLRSTMYFFILLTLWYYVKKLDKNYYSGTFILSFLAFLTSETFGMAVFIFWVLMFLEWWTKRRPFVLSFLTLFTVLETSFVLYRTLFYRNTGDNINTPFTFQLFPSHARQFVADILFHQTSLWFYFPIIFMLFIVLILTIKQQSPWKNILQRKQVTISEIFFIGIFLFSFLYLGLLSFSAYLEYGGVESLVEYFYHTIFLMTSFIALAFFLINKITFSNQKIKILMNISLVFVTCIFISINLIPQRLYNRINYQTIRYAALWRNFLYHHLEQDSHHNYISYLTDDLYQKAYTFFIPNRYPNTKNNMDSYPANPNIFNHYFSDGMSFDVGPYSIRKFGNIFNYTKIYGPVNFYLTNRLNKGCWSNKPIQMIALDQQHSITAFAIRGGIPSLNYLPYTIIITDALGNMLGQGVWKFSNEAFRHLWTIPFFRNKSTYEWVAFFSDKNKQLIKERIYHAYVITNTHRTCHIGSFKWVPQQKKLIDTTDRSLGYTFDDITYGDVPIKITPWNIPLSKAK